MSSAALPSRTTEIPAPNPARGLESVGDHDSPPGSGRWVWSAYAAALSAVFLASLPVSWSHVEIGAVRNAQVALSILLAAALVWRWRKGAEGGARVSLPRWTKRMFLASGGVYLIAASLSRYGSFHVNGVDFSIFDWMLENTLRGRFMFTPIYEVNHFSVHPSHVMLALVPLHALWRSPLMLCVLGGVLLWAAALPLWQLAVALTCDEGFALLAVVSLWTNPWSAPLINGGFRIESWYPLASLLFLSGWVRRRPLALWGGAALLLSIKEDAPLYLIGFIVTGILFERARWRELLALAMASVGVFGLDVGVVQPLARGPKPSPAYLLFWSGYGTRVSQIALTAITHPFRVARDVATSAWYRFFGPALVLPLIDLRSLCVLAPGLLLLGMASYPAMHEYAIYYPVPLVAFALWGILDFAAVPSSPRSASLRRAAGRLALLLFPLFGRGYVRTPRPDWAALRGVRLAEQRLDGFKGPVCVQPSLFPHLSYALDLHLLDEACLRRPGAVGLVGVSVDSTPYGAPAIARWLDAARSEGQATSVGGGIYLLGLLPR